MSLLFNIDLSGVRFSADELATVVEWGSITHAMYSMLTCRLGQFLPEG